MPPLALPEPTVDGGRVDDLIRDVLQRPEYRDLDGTWLTRLRETVQDWVLERLADVFSSGAGSVIAWVLLGAAVVAAVALATRLGRTVRRDAGVAGPASEAIVQASARDWLERARSARGHGDHREAIRCAHRALVAGLAARGAVDEVPGTTVGEYRHALRGAPPELTGPFEEVSGAFERVWYAHQDADAALVDAVLARVEAVGAP